MPLTVCPHDCPDTCSIVATIVNGRLTACQGDPDHPFTRGFLCHKVAAYSEQVYSKERVLYPHKRTGPKGSGTFARISWDEALDRIAQRLSALPGESILPYSYGGTMGLVHRNAGHPFFHRLGACRLERTICDEAADHAWRSCIGTAVGTDIERAAQSDLIVNWGMNSAVVNIHAWTFFREAQRAGGRVIVIDPIRTETADNADEHLSLRPGTDGALALALARVLVEEKRVDMDYLARMTRGYEAFFACLKKDYAPICGVPEAKIRDLARRLARAKGPFFRLGVGFSRHSNGGQAVRAITMLAALLGIFRKPGGGATFETWEAFDFNLDSLRGPEPSTRKVNMVQLGEALTDLQPPIQALFVYHSNPAAVAPDQNAVLRGLAREDLFTVVHERMMTDTALYADVLLPAPTSLEYSDLYRSYGHYYLQRSRPVLAPMGECKSNVDLFNALARKMGFADAVFGETDEDRIERLLREAGPKVRAVDRKTLDEGRPVRLPITREDPFEKKFPTPSGKFEFGDFPEYVPCVEGFEARAADELQLLVPPSKHFLNSTFGASESLVRRQGSPVALLHPDDATIRGIADGDAVHVHNARGKVRVTACLTDRIHPGVVALPGVFWTKHIGGPGGNALTSQRLTDLGASSTFHCSLVKVEKVT